MPLRVLARILLFNAQVRISGAVTGRLVFYSRWSGGTHKAAHWAFGGMRPSEVFLMTVGDIDTKSVPGIWLYRLASHKTQKKTRKKRVIPLNA